jgi:hypothetical protein
MSALPIANFNRGRHYQHGAALMVMLVIMERSQQLGVANQAG